MVNMLYLRQRAEVGLDGLNVASSTLRQSETHPVCLSCSAESATEAISLALHSVPRVFHLALKTKNVQDSRQKFEDEDLQALLEEDRCQIFKQLSDTLNDTEMAFSKRLHNLGLVQKAENWLPYELSEKNKKLFVNCCLNDAKRNHFCIEL